MYPILDWGIPLIAWLQGLGGWLIEPMKLLTFLGNEEFYLLLMPTILWCFDALLGFRIGVILLTSASINSILKVAIGLPRPYWVSDKVKALAEGSSFGLPSGHSQNALAVWGRLAAAMGRRWVTLALAALILLISTSRIFLAVHFPTDVLGGWLAGGLLLAVFLRFEDKAGRRLKAMPVWRQAALALLASLFLIALGVGVDSLTARQGVPQAWIETAQQAFPAAEPIHPRTMDDLVATAGALFGLGAGGAMLFAWGKFDARGPWGKRGLRYVIGVIGVVALFFGLKLILPDDASLVAQSLRYLRYALVGFWAAYLAPRVFVALGLA